MRNPWLLITGRGRILLVVGASVAFLAAMLGHRDVFVLGLLLLVTPVVAAIAARFTRLRLACERRVDPTQLAIGEPLIATLSVSRTGKMPAGLLSFEDTVPPELGSRPRFTASGLGPDAPLIAQYQLTGRSRGRYRIGPLLVRTSDPFGLAQVDRQFHATSEIMVTPKIVALSQMSNAGGGGATGESRPHRIGVSGQEDILVREYRDGDDVRRVHWRSTARRGELMVRREEQAWDPNVTVILDSRDHAHAGIGVHSSFEWSVSAAASIGLHFLDHKYSVNLVDSLGPISGSDADVETRVAARGNLLHALTDVQTTVRSDDFMNVVSAVSGTESGQLLVAITGRLTMSDARQLLHCQRNRSTAMAIVCDVDSWVPRPQRADGATRDEHDDAVAILRESLWRVVTVTRSQAVDAAWSQLEQAGGAA